jgi:hypothetical protein
MPTALLIVAILVVAAVLIFARAAQAERQLAEGIVQSLKRNYPREVECAFLDAAQLPAVCVGPLDAAQDDFAAAGLTPIGDLAMLNILDNEGRLIPVRAWVDVEQGLNCGAYFIPELGHTTFDIGSELSDGRTISTSNAVLAAVMADVPPGYERRYVPVDTPFAEMLRQHRARVEQALAENSRLTLCPAPATRSALIADLQRDAMRKHNHRRSVGWITREELRRYATPDLDVARLDALYLQVRRVVDDAA